MIFVLLMSYIYDDLILCKLYNVYLHTKKREGEIIVNWCVHTMSYLIFLICLCTRSSVLHVHPCFIESFIGTLQNQRHKDVSIELKLYDIYNLFE